MKKLIRRYVPDRQMLHETSHLRPLQKYLQNVYLWHLNRRSVSGAVAVGLFCSYLPMPLESLVAALLAVILRVNLPISFALVWISNPLTWVPMFGAGYLVGARIMNIPTIGIDEMTMSWLLEQALPLWLGSVILGSLLALVGYVASRVAWRWFSIRSWQRRKRRLQQKRNSPTRPGQAG